MGTPLATGLVYALAPATVGVIAAILLLLPARREMPREADAEAKGRAMIFFAIPLTAPIFALVAAFLAQAPEAPELRTQLLVLGVAAFVQATAQGWLGARAMRTATTPQSFGRALVPLAAVEIVTIGALLWVFLSLPGSASA